jgi:hypothetical protein
MTTMSEARCPKCHIEVGATWRWCLACGYDPDGSAQRVRQAAIEARQREGGWLPLAIVLVGLLVGGAILWRTTPDDTTPTVSPSTAAEVTSWTPFSPPDAGFRVDLPGAPVASPPGATGPGGRPAATWAIGAGAHLFSVTVSDTGRSDLAPGRNGAEAEGALRGYVTDLAGAVSGKVKSAEPTEGDGRTIDFEIDDAVVGQVRGRVALVGTRFCSVAVSSRELSDEIADHVIDSFVLQ